MASGTSERAGFAGTYAGQAATYDRTRSAGAETAAPVLAALSAAPGRAVLDIGGGTGNYAAAMRAAGYAVTVADRSGQMLAVAAAKGLPVVRADAAALPFGDRSADAATMVSMLHQVPRWRKALAEARRVLRPGGVLCLLLYTREHMDSHFFLRYFPAGRGWAIRDTRPVADYAAELPGAGAVPLQIRGTDDLTMHVMRRHPALALDPDLRAQTSFFARMLREHPAELRAGLDKLAADIAAGTLPAGFDRDLPDGDAYLVTWRKPA